MALSTTRRGISVSGDTQHGAGWCHHCLRLRSGRSPWTSLEQDFSDFQMHSNHTGGSGENADSDAAGLGWEGTYCIPNMLPGETKAPGPQAEAGVLNAYRTSLLFKTNTCGISWVIGREECRKDGSEN